MTRIIWRAVLAPLGVAAENGRELRRTLAISTTDGRPNVPLCLSENMVDLHPVGTVEMVSLDADSRHLIAAGWIDSDDVSTITRIRSHELVPGFNLHRVATHEWDDGRTEVTAGQLLNVTAQPAVLSLWAHARFELGEPA